MDEREKRGIQIARTPHQILQIDKSTYVVKSESTPKMYKVSTKYQACSCPDYKFRGGICKHIHAVMHLVN